MSHLFRGLPVRDPGPDDPDVITATVDRSDKASVSRDPDHCIVARGLSRVKGVLGGHVGARTVYVMFEANPQEWVRYQLTDRSIAKVRAFDEDPDAVRGAMEWIAGTEVQMRPIGGVKRLGARPPGRGSDKEEGIAPNLRRRPILRHVGMGGVDDVDAP